MRAEPPGIVKNVEPGRTGAQRLENSARADGIADTLIHTILHRYIEVVAYIGETGDLNGVDDKIALRQQVATFGRSTYAPALPAAGNEAFSDLVCELQAARVDIHQRETSLIQSFDLQNVGHELASKHGASGT